MMNALWYMIIMEYPAYEENREFYEKIGLKEYDVENLKRYNLCFVNDLETGKCIR